jgi:hypothetical protein
MKKILLIVVLLFVAIQFIPVAYNENKEVASKSIEQIHHVPEGVLTTLKTSCYDCHSNQTHYPWYAKIQPVAFWIGDHIEEGKDELNFSTFGDYSLRKQFHKLEEISEQIEENEMPLKSYTIIHGNTVLSDIQKNEMKEWVTSLRDSFQRSYPADSLKRKKRV